MSRVGRTHRKLSEETHRGRKISTSNRRTSHGTREQRSETDWKNGQKKRTRRKKGWGSNRDPLVPTLGAPSPMVQPLEVKEGVRPRSGTLLRESLHAKA